ncbi:hypothetical protein HYW75_03635 [Candidatus Pacearchaeota archaeon]|nr:hypothetical protein [Candidatus Pacearchaeota archaeon]
MKVIIKIRFGASKEKFEKFGDGRYLLYLSFEEDSDTKTIVRELLSRHLGTPAQRIEFIGVDKNKNWIFDIH